MTSASRGVEPAYRRKLIEVDLPLDAINAESAREKSIRTDTPPPCTCGGPAARWPLVAPSSSPAWWTTPLTARSSRPLKSRPPSVSGSTNSSGGWSSGKAPTNATRRTWSYCPKPAGKSPAPWPAPATKSVPDKNDRAAILSYINNKVLPIYDPFCGGGSIPLEAQRLGLRAVGSDLNPVAVLITKALIELPHKVANQPPVNPKADKTGVPVGKGKKAQVIPWRGAAGLADDIRYYGRWMREKAWERIGHLYPTAKLPGGGEATVIAWLWARTIPCPNPACGVSMPLMRTFRLSTVRGQYWTNPIVDLNAKQISFEVGERSGDLDDGTVGDNGAVCIACGTPQTLEYVRKAARDGYLSEQMTAIVAEGNRRRLFLSPTDEHAETAQSASVPWRPNGSLPEQALGFRVQGYGFTQWHQLFADRQLIAVTTFSDLLPAVRQQLKQDGASSDYANTVGTYLALSISKMAYSCSNFSRWENAGNFVAGVFSRQALPMMWDYAETNPFSKSTRNWMAEIEWVAEVVDRLPNSVNLGETYQADATTAIHSNVGPVIVTDPPYYDNIGYADLSDYFYVWLRPLLREIYPELFLGILSPKEEEMIATPFRFSNPRERFEDSLNQTLRLVRERCSPQFPSSIFYAYKQQEEERGGRTSTGWETMLAAVVASGFQVMRTWPMRTELANRPRSLGSNALASSVVLVCRPRPVNAPPASRREFLNALDAELPTALDNLTREGHIAPVDLAQAAIGPGMQIYSRYSQVETISGEQVTVREALAAINQAIANYDDRQEGELDPPTRFCIDWLKQHGFGEGQYGEAQTLAQAKNVAVEDELRDGHGLVMAEGGSVQLQPPAYFSASRMPSSGRMTAWEGCFRMAWNLDHEDGSIQGAADVARRMGSDAESVERLARILYNHFDRIRDSRRAVLFNNLVTSWDDIQAEMAKPPQGQMALR